jgi:hypothetical protein
MGQEGRLLAVGEYTGKDDPAVMLDMVIPL